jgi:hypothetical protein
MPDPLPGDRPPPHAAKAPKIEVAGIVVTGSGFLPDEIVTIRISRPEDDVSDYLTYPANRVGRLRAELPASAANGTMYIAATDHRPDPGDACGRLWSNTCTLFADQIQNETGS